MSIDLFNVMLNNKIFSNYREIIQPKKVLHKIPKNLIIIISITITTNFFPVSGLYGFKLK